MKTKAAISKGSREPVARKPKKPDRKDYVKEKVECKKPRRPIQKNRFTKIEELPNPTQNMPLELFGSLVFNFAKETSDVQISDSTGDYELRVSNETLNEFKLKVLLGIDQRSKPKFTILLGDCQCYPELLEGPLVMKKERVDVNNEPRSNYVNVGEQIEVVVSEENRSMKNGLADGESDFGHCTDIREGLDGAGPMGEIVKTDDVEEPDSSLKCEAEKCCSRPHTEQGDVPCSEDELTIQSKKSAKKKNVEKLGKPRSREHSRKKHARTIRSQSSNIQDSASTYMSNLEGFMQFLMNDEISYTALKKTNLSNAARRIVSGRNMIKYSDGREFIITFEEKDSTTKHKKVKSKDNNESSDCPPNSIKSESDTSLTTLKELLSAGDDKTGKKLEEELKTREETMEANAFVEDVKKELIEWQAKCGESIDVTIVCSETMVMSEEKTNGNFKIEVSDEPNALDKIEEVYEDATSNVSNSSNLAQADSLEHFFLELDEYDQMIVSKETKNIVKPQIKENKGLGSVVHNDRKSNDTSGTKDGMHFNHNYIPPVPLNMTSTADIELMWMSFVKKIYSSDERLKTLLSNPADNTTQRLYKSDLHIGQYHQSYSENSNSMRSSGNLNVVTRQKSFDNNVYPGQHCFPYFVEANLKRVNSVMSSMKVSSSNTSRNINQPERDLTLIGCPLIHGGSSEPKYNFPPGVRVFNQGKLNTTHERRASYPLQRNPNTLSQERFPIRRNRIFFNPNVSAGDWY